MSNNIILDLSSNIKNLKNNTTLVKNIIEKELIPQIDLEQMSKMVIGKEYWTKASQEEKNKFQNAFKKYVISIYFNAFSSYSGEKISFLPKRNSEYSSQFNVDVDTEINRTNGEKPIQVSYKLIKENNSWKIYDFSIDRISLIQTYRSQFASVLRNGGISKLTSKLESINIK